MRGFSLPELIIVIAIIGITLAFGVPSFQTMIENNRLSISANTMLESLMRARSESSKQVKYSGLIITGNTWDLFVASEANIVGKYETAPGINLTITSAGLNDSKPTFRPEGRLNSSTAITMTFSTTGSSSQRTLTIDPSGKVQITDP